jgi:hypothetical protein
MNLPTVLQNQPKKNGNFEFTERVTFRDESTKTLSRLRDHSIARPNVIVQPVSRTIIKFTAALNVVQNYAYICILLSLVAA